MSYKVEYSKTAKKQIKKMDQYTKIMIMNWINKNLVGCNDPREQGKALKGNSENQWRYRVGDYRLICDIVDDRLILLMLSIGHQKEVYK